MRRGTWCCITGKDNGPHRQRNHQGSMAEAWKFWSYAGWQWVVTPASDPASPLQAAQGLVIHHQTDDEINRHPAQLAALESISKLSP